MILCSQSPNANGFVKKQPLVEVFGYPIDNQTAQARKVREQCYCPYNNIVQKCTKNSVAQPLGVCAVFEGDRPAITCPVRFREGWQIVSDAAEFFFPKGTEFRSLSEVRLKDGMGKSAGNIDHIVVALDEDGKVVDFGALEVQGVYISGNVQKPFSYFMQSPSTRSDFDWRGKPNYPRPDFLSSSRKRLAPQLLYKGGILKAWGKKLAVAVDETFWDTLPTFDLTSRSKADIAWLVYALELDVGAKRYKLVRRKICYTRFEDALLKLTQAKPGRLSQFVALLDAKVSGKIPVRDDPDPSVDDEHDVA